nr:unnamed protein product [Spirometra erinaceieuropaei]
MSGRLFDKSFGLQIAENTRYQLDVCNRISKSISEDVKRISQPASKYQKSRAEQKRDFEDGTNGKVCATYDERMEKLRIPYRDGPPMSIADRKKWLLRLMEMLTKHEADFCNALHRDLHKCKHEALICDILPVKSEISMILSNLQNWADGETLPRVFVSLLDTCKVQPQPFGKVLILAPWNYPVFLLLIPLAGAIAAGNVVVCKPSELAPATEQLLTLLLPKFLDESICCVVNGGPEETQQLLNTTSFDFIFFTGSPHVGRIVMQAASKNLTPVSLELGGKCPVYLDESANLNLAAKRIISGKLLNAGQTCVAPDYILCHRRVLNAFVEECLALLTKFLGEDPKERLARLLKTTEGEIVIGGTFDVVEKFVAPTIVTNVRAEDVLMQDEIFGPILPIITVDSCDDAIRFVTSNERPLAIYVFTEDKNQYSLWSSQTSSGSIVFNECVLQLSVNNLPFGGVGNSGFGRYRGKANFDLFSNPRSYVDRSKNEMANEKFRYPPFTDNSTYLMLSICDNILDLERAAIIIQRKWRSHVDTQVFTYMRRLLLNSRDLVPEEFLKFINPREATLADAASGLVVRLRLNGETFPPIICYKIFTQRPVKDLGSTSPKNYAYEREDGDGLPNIRQKLGQKQNWYKRVDGNNWRPVTDEMLIPFVPNLVASRKNKFTVHKRRFRKLFPNCPVNSEENSEKYLRQYLPSERETDFCPNFSNISGNLTIEEDLVAWTQKLDFDKFIREWEQLSKMHLDLPAAYKVLRHHNHRAQDQTTTPDLRKPHGDSPTLSLLGEEEEEPPDRPPD